jgi:hypothetical protein
MPPFQFPLRCPAELAADLYGELRVQVRRNAAITHHFYGELPAPAQSPLADHLAMITQKLRTPAPA